MALTPEQLEAFKKVNESNTSDQSVKQTLDLALRTDPDEFVAQEKLARDTGLPLDTVKSDVERVKRIKTINDVNLKGTPTTAEFLKNFRNAQLAHDDINNLRSIEQTQDKNNILENAIAKTGNRLNQLTGNLIESIGTMADDLGQMGDWLNAGIVITEDGGIEFESDMRKNPNYKESGFSTIGRAISEGEAYDYQETFSWENFKGDMNAKNLAGYIIENGPSSFADMIFAMNTLPLYISSRTQEIAEQRVDFKEGVDKVDTAEMAEALPTAVAVSIIEKLAGHYLITKGNGAAWGVVAKKAGSEGATEFAQEGVEYVGERAGTDQEMTLAEGFDRALAGAVLGAGTGGSFATVEQGVRKVQTAKNKKAVEQIQRHLKTANEQAYIDEMTVLMQSGKVNMRDPEAMRAFLDSLPKDETIEISAEFVEQMLDQEVTLPGYIMDQYEPGLGTNVTISLGQFATDFAPRDDLMEFMRPHIKMSSDSLTQTEINEEGETFTESIDRIMKNQAYDQAVKDEADQIFQSVAEQLVATGRMSEDTANISASIIPAVVTTQVQRLRERGIDVGVQEFYEKYLNFRIEGPDGQTEMDGQVFNQDDEIKMLEDLIGEFDSGPTEQRQTVFGTDPEFVQRAKASRDRIRQSMPQRDDTVGFTPERVDKVIREYAHMNGNDSKGLITYVDPLDFIFATTLDPAFIESETGDLDQDQLRDEVQTPFLDVEDGKVVGHEGRHRMMALAKAGVRRTPIIIRNKAGYTDQSFEGQVTLDGQYDENGVQSLPITIDGGRLLVPGNRDAINAEIQSLEPKFLFQQEQSEYDQAVAKGLDMSQEARMKRAEEMGFDTSTVYYHGTKSSSTFESFDVPSEGVFFSPRKELASSYARFGDDPIPALLKMENPFNPQNDDHIDQEWVQEWIDFWRDEDGWVNRYSGEEMTNDEVLSMISNTELYNYDDSFGERWRDFLGTLRDHHDGFLGYDPTDGGPIAVVFDPSNIRSVNAAFDPDFKDSPKLLAQSTGLYNNMEHLIRNMKLDQWRNSVKWKKQDEEQLEAAIKEDPESRKVEKLKARKAKALNPPKAKGSSIWEKIKASSEKKEAVEWSGIEEFLMNDPDRLFSREEVLTFVDNNGVNVELIIADEQGENVYDMDFEWDKEIEDDQEYYQYEIDDAVSEFESGGDSWLLDVDDFMDGWLEENIHLVLENYEPSIDEDLWNEIQEMDDPGDQIVAIADAGYDVNNDMRQSALDDFIEVATERARENYMENPFTIYKTDKVEDWEIKGQDELGYWVEDDRGRRIEIDAFDFDAAEEEFRRVIDEYGVTGSGDESTTVKHEGAVVNEYADNYREFKLTLPEVSGEFVEPIHFSDPNIVVFLRTVDDDLTIDTTEPFDDIDERLEILKSTQPTMDDAKSDTIPLNSWVSSKKKRVGELDKEWWDTFQSTWDQASEDERERHLNVTNEAEIAYYKRFWNAGLEPSDVGNIEDNVDYDQIKQRIDYLKSISDEEYNKSYQEVVNAVESRRGADGFSDEKLDAWLDKAKDYTSWEGIINATGYDSSIGPVRLYRENQSQIHMWEQKLQRMKDEWGDIRNVKKRVKGTGRSYKTFDIQEIQSDWHQRARENGYSTGEIDPGELDAMWGEMITDLNGEIREQYYKNDVGLSLPITESKFINILSELAANNFKHYYDGDTGVEYDAVIKIAEKIEKTDKKWLYGLKDRLNTIANLQLQSQHERYGMPDAPFKGDAWMSLGLKTAIVQAVNEGHEAISVVNSKVMNERWGQPHHSQYDQKLPSLLRQLTGEDPVLMSYRTGQRQEVKTPPTLEVKRLSDGNFAVFIDGEADTSVTFGKPQDADRQRKQILKDWVDENYEAGYWIVPITDKLRQQVKDNGFSLFQYRDIEGMGLYLNAAKKVEEMNLPQWKNGGEASGKSIWEKIKASGIRKEEVNFLGLEEWLTDGDWKFTREDVVDFIKDNGPQLSELMAEANTREGVIDWERTDLDFEDSNQYERVKDHIRSAVEGILEGTYDGADNPVYMRLGERYIDFVQEFVQNDQQGELFGKSQAESIVEELYGHNEISAGRIIKKIADVKGIDVLEWTDLDTEEKIETAMEEAAHDEYYNSPDYTLEYGSIRITRDEDYWYVSNFDTGEEYGYAYSESEAEVIARENLGAEGGDTEWGKYITPGPIESYREYKMIVPPRSGDVAFRHDIHFKDPNISGFSRQSIREVDGKRTLQIDETQNDWTNEQRKHRNKTIEHIMSIMERNRDFTKEERDELKRNIREFDDKTPKSDLFWTLKKEAADMLPNDYGWGDFELDFSRYDVDLLHAKVDNLRAELTREYYNKLKSGDIKASEKAEFWAFTGDMGLIGEIVDSNDVAERLAVYKKQVDAEFEPSARFLMDASLKMISQDSTVRSAVEYIMEERLGLEAGHADNMKPNELFSFMSIMLGGKDKAIETFREYEIIGVIPTHITTRGLIMWDDPDADYQPTDESVYNYIASELAGKDKRLSKPREEAAIKQVILDGMLDPIPPAVFRGDDWLKLMLKRNIVQAVEEDAEQITWPTAETISTQRWSEKFDYKPQYDNKMPSFFEKELRKITGQKEGHSRRKVYDPNQGAEVWVVDITPEIRQAVERERFSVWQDPEANRGYLAVKEDEMVMRLTKASDLSTFLHESSHMFLEMERKLASDFGYSEDQKVILDWLGVNSFDEIGVEHHEKYAETFEVYLMEGRAPSQALRKAFDNFKRWLKNIYKMMTSDPRLARADLNDKIRDVFDRLLATDEEIAYVKADPLYQELFRSKEQAGMTDEEWEKYQKTIADRDKKAEKTVDEKVLTEWRKRRSAEWREEKKPMIDEEKERLLGEPVYAIMSDAKDFPMDYHVLKDIMGWDKQPGKFIGRTKGDGIDPQEYSELYGYPSVQAMVKDILDSPSLNDAAEQAAQQRMIDKYGDILNDGTIEEEARAAMHNEKQAELLLQEIRKLGRKAPEINRDNLKNAAKRTISEMKYKEIQPSKYYRNEIKAARNASTAKTDADKLKYKVQQLANHYLYTEALATKKQMESQRRYVRGVQNRKYNAKQIDPAYIQNMKAIAGVYDLRSNPERVRKVSEVLEWYQAQVSDPNQFIQLELLDPMLVMALAAKKDGKLVDITLPTFDDLTADDLNGLVTQLKHLRHIGGQLSEDAKADMRIEAESLTESIIENGGNDKPGTRGIPSKYEVKKRHLDHMINKLPSLRNLIRKLDNAFKGREDSAAYNLIYRAVENANSEKIKLAREVYERFEQELSDLHMLGLNRKDYKTYTLESGLSLTMHPESRFMMALYWGTESSREAIREGFSVTDKDVMNILSDLSNDQLLMLNNIWRVNESIWPDLSAASVKQYGVAPPKLDAVPFEVNGVRLTGGHMRLFYDSTELEMKGEQEETGKLYDVMPTKAGSLHARVGSGGRPPALDRNNIVRALDDSIHFIAFAETGNKIATLMNNREVKAAIERKHGQGFYRALVENIESITANRTQRETVPALAAWLKLLRRAATMKHLAYSIRNTVQQISAVPIAMEEVGTMNFVKAAVRYGSPETHTDFVNFVNQRSEFMRDRASLVNREAAEYLRKLNVEGKYHYMWDQFARFGFTPQTIVDAQLAYPTWMAKWEQAMEEHGDDRKAASEADTAVAESIGSGSDLHLGGAFQSTQSELVRTLTLFGSWFNAYYQRVYKSTGGFTEIDAETAKTLLTTPFIVGVISAVVIMDGPEDDEELLAWALKRYGAFMGGTIPLVRDVISAFTGFSPKTLMSGGSESPYRFVSELESYAEGRQSGLKTAVDLSKVVTTVVPVPGSGNLIRMLDFVDSNAQGNETGSAPKKIYQSLVEGPDRNK